LVQDVDLGFCPANIEFAHRAQNEKARLFPSFCYKIPVTNRFFSGFSDILRITINAVDVLARVVVPKLICEIPYASCFV
jgi:hypothetical protein